MSKLDHHNSYGWISIFLHWVGATVIIALWFMGDSTNSTDVKNLGYMGQLHVSLALTFYLVLIARILWRLRSGHPRLEGQGNVTHWLGKMAHYAMLILIILMLISGPLKIWSLGGTLAIFSTIYIPSPFGYLPWLSSFATMVHQYAGTALIILITIHLCSAMKHLMFHDDETFIRILLPRRKDEK